MSEGYLLLVLGAVAGAVLASVITALVLRKTHASRLAAVQAGLTENLIELEGKARSAEAIADERRREIEKKEIELADTRLDLTSEREAKARLEEAQRRLEEEIVRLGEMERKLGETFKALSYDALSKNSAEFMKQAEELIKLAEEKLKTQAVEGTRELEGKKELIDKSIESIGKTLSEVQRRIEEVGKVSGEKITEVATLIKKHEEVTVKLKDTTEHLGTALASTKKRGEWGERMAEDIIRLVGMIEGVNYVKQKTLDTVSRRPDYTFFLPHDLKINMDVKFPMDNYMRYLNAASDHDRRRHRDELLRNARTMIRQVTTREYINPAEQTVDYVIVFIPNEQVYGFINEGDTTIMDEALKQKAVLCSPSTLYAVLAVVRQAVENFTLEQTASEILKLLAEFSKQWTLYKEKFKTMGERLDAARKEYDSLTTTRSNALERPLRKIEDLRKQKSLSLTDDANLDDLPVLRGET
ncbi:MAG: DNA recombination protein RmuC [Chloroflexota bacterium]